MGFFKDMNLARGVVLASVLGSAVLGWLGWEEQDKLRTLEAAAAKPEIEKDMVALMTLGHEHTQLKSALDGQSGAGSDDIQSYVRRQATTPRVDLGNVELDKDVKQISKGINDDIYRIYFRDKDRSFDRTRLTNFLYMLEEGSPRVKVTEIKLETADKRLKDHEVPNDLWAFEARITVRQRTAP
jgi:hypothetical protein